jgi:hypothetical protein
MKKWTMSGGALWTFICIVILGIADLGLVVLGGPNSSVSNFLINLGYIPGRFALFSFGCTIGHLFFYMYPEDEEDPIKQRLFDAVCGAVAVIAFSKIVDTWKKHAPKK